MSKTQLSQQRVVIVETLSLLTFWGLGKMAPVVVDTALRHGVSTLPELLTPVKPDDIPAFLNAHNLDVRYTADAIFIGVLLEPVYGVRQLSNLQQCGAPFSISRGATNLKAAERS